MRKTLNDLLEKFQQKKKRKLTPVEKYSIRLGYFSSAFIILAPHLLENGDMGYLVYVLGGVFGLPQVLVAKQWNIVLINLNVVIAYSLLLFK